MENRWEYRVWQTRPEGVEAFARRLGTDAETHEDHVDFLVSTASFRSHVHLSSGHLRVEIMLDEQDGVAAWRGKLDDALPAAGTTIAEVVYPALGIATAALAEESYDAAALIDTLEDQPAIRHFSAQRQVDRFALDGATIEIVSLDLETGPLRGLGVMADDAKTVLAVAHRLGIQNQPNQGYPAALQRV
ncbi:MAG: hypothetical protein AAGD38_17420 [Acidobacteriota bacterium]